MTQPQQTPVLLTGGTGTTGRRIAARLRAAGVAVRQASRTGSPPFDWGHPETWAANLAGVEAAYIAFAPDLTMPGAVATVERFCAAARTAGVERIVLLAGRGEREAEAAEDVVRGSGARWTIVRASWFDQNFSEGMLAAAVRAGVIALPGGSVAEPFVDAEDIADVAAAALLDPRHHGRTYDVTGPRLMTFTDVAAELAAVIGRPVGYLDVSAAEFAAAAVADGMPADEAVAWATLFTNVLDGRNASLGAGVDEALGRAPRDFSEFLARTVADGVWNAPAEAAR